MSKNHIPEKELQTDPFFSFLGKIFDYCKSNKTSVQWMAFGVVGAILLGIIIGNYRQSSKDKDLIAFEQATTKILIEQYLEDHSGGQYYPQALFKLANYHYDDGKYKDAVAGYEELLKKYPDNILADQALLGIGYANIEMGNYDDAVNSFQNLIEKYPASPFISDANLNLARSLMKQGQYQEAKEVVDAFVEDNPNSVLAPEAEKLLPEINRKL